MPTNNYKNIALFLLLLTGLLITIWMVDATRLASLTTLGAAVAIAIAITFVWHFTFHRPMRRSLDALAKRVSRLSYRCDGPPSTEADIADPHIRHIAQRLSRRHRRFAAYASRLRDQWRRLRGIYRNSHDAILVFDPASGALKDCNPRAAELFSLPVDELIGRSIDELHDEEPGYLRSLVDDVMDGRHGRSIRTDYRAADGRVLPVEVSLSRLELNTGNLLLCIARDVSEHEHAAQRIEHLAYHDTLTGLPNRTLLTDRVNRALARARRTGEIGALLFLDLDKFKRINDSLGHSVGDELLKELARRLRTTLREEDTVARLGGDEFVVLLERLGEDLEAAVDKAREIATKIRTVFADEYELEGHELFVTASIGIVTFPHDGDTVDTLLRHADTAMYHAKGDGRDGARVFERRMDEAAISRLRLENELRAGLRDGQFELFFQPVLTIKDGRVLGAEVLLRWRHPTAGLIAPTEFLPYIENGALMLKLDDWVLLESCGLLGRIQNDPDMQTPERLAINISHQQFVQAEFVDRIREITELTGADPKRLQFEITETMLIKDTKESVDRMNALRQLGINFAIDDFGTGYSSLADLRQLPIDTIKIDRTFIRDLASDPNDAAIVRAILSMAHHIGVNAIAEGVETREQLQFLRDADCAYYQGYLGRPPLDRETFMEELRYSAELYTRNASPSEQADLT